MTVIDPILSKALEKLTTNLVGPICRSGTGTVTSVFSVAFISVSDFTPKLVQ